MQTSLGVFFYVDINLEKPSEIIRQSSRIDLGIGINRVLEDCGVNPSTILKIENNYFLFYTDYLRYFKTPYYILSGVAISNDDFTIFSRLKNTPVFERTNDELSLRSEL